MAVLASILLAASYGCATEPQPQQPAAGAASAAPAPAKAERSRGSLTGSRLPPMDDDDTGSSMVGSQSGSDYMHDRNSSTSPMRGQ